MDYSAVTLTKWSELIEEEKRRALYNLKPELTDKKYKKLFDQAISEDNFNVSQYISDRYIDKWSSLIVAARNYWLDSVPTGLSDAEFDNLEKEAIKDGFFVRDYIYSTAKGLKVRNYDCVNKITKVKVDNMTMLQAIKNSVSDENPYCLLKYDGSSLAIYLDPATGIPKSIVGCGNLNISNEGIDQTWKLISLIPKRFPKGIMAIQAEALVDTDRLFENKERARQKANGLINSKNCENEVKSLLTIRAYRYWLDESIPESKTIASMDYKKVLNSFETVRDPFDDHITFAPADVWTVDELGSWVECDSTKTSTGTFLNDGWVIYSKNGSCIGALKYAGAGSGDLIKTTVKSIQWNDQSVKGKDSWSANVIIDPVVINGVTIKKPSAGSVSKLVKNNITPEAEVSIVLANSTIPMVGSCLTPGNGDFQWPTCSCGFKLSEKNIFGSNLKCGNVDCSCRKSRMKAYLYSLTCVATDLDLNKLLVIDRFKWESTNIDIVKLLKYVEIGDMSGYYNYLKSFLTTKLQIANLDLVYKASFEELFNIYKINNEKEKN